MYEAIITVFAACLIGAFVGIMTALCLALQSCLFTEMPLDFKVPVELLIEVIVLSFGVAVIRTNTYFLLQLREFFICFRSEIFDPMIALKHTKSNVRSYVWPSVFFFGGLGIMLPQSKKFFPDNFYTDNTRLLLIFLEQQGEYT